MQLESDTAVAVAMASSAALIQLLAWELPYATCVGVDKKKKKKKDVYKLVGLRYFIKNYHSK